MNFQQNPDGSWTPSVPEPLWVRPWWRLFRWTPSCCGRTYAHVPHYHAHWFSEHVDPTTGEPLG